MSKNNHVLKRCIDQVRGSKFAKDYSLDKVVNIAELRNAIPLLDYSSYAPYIDQCRGGNLGALFASNIKVPAFTLTSGTTGSRRLIPMTAEHIQELQKIWLAWGTRTYAKYPSLFIRGLVPLASLQFPSPHQSDPTVLDMSGLLLSQQPWYVKLFAKIPDAAYAIEDQVVKYYFYLRLLLARSDFGGIVTATPASLVALATFAYQWRHELMEDFRSGSVRYADKIPSQLLGNVRRVSAKRIAFLERLANAEDQFLPRNYWPNLRLLATWTDGPMRHYQGDLRHYFGNHVAIENIGLVASEGHFTSPIPGDFFGSRPNQQAYFFEFEDLRNGQVLSVDELNVGAEYGLVISNLSGLLRYRMHDIVRCNAYVDDSPLLEFRRKSNQFSDISGEKISANQVASVLEDLQSNFSLVTNTSALAPKGRGYCLVTEATLSADQKIQLAIDLDHALRRVNFIYAEHRDAQKLSHPGVLCVPRESFARIRLRNMQSKGASMEQYKPSCLMSKKDLENILA